MNRDFTFGPDRTISLVDTDEGEYRITVTRRADAGLEVFLEVPGAGDRSDTLAAARCGRPTRRGTPCQARVASAGMTCHRHRKA
jgi:hypothetical protein